MDRLDFAFVTEKGEKGEKGTGSFSSRMRAQGTGSFSGKSALAGAQLKRDRLVSSRTPPTSEEGSGGRDRFVFTGGRDRRKGQVGFQALAAARRKQP